jgi:hypothetical protein
MGRTATSAASEVSPGGSHAGHSQPTSPATAFDYRGDWACCEECRPLVEEEGEAHELTAAEIEEARAYIRRAFGSITVNPATGKQWDPVRVALQPA